MEWMLMPLRRYADFRGRSRRMEFWMWQLFKFLVGIAFLLLILVVAGGSIMALAGGGSPGAGAMAGMGVAVVLYLLMLVAGLAVIVPDIAVVVRRLHDTERSGKWLLAVIVPIVLGYVLLFAGAAAQSSAVALIGGIVVVGGLVMAIVLLVFMFLPGTVGPNRYGADPKAGEYAVAGEPAAY